MESFATPFGFSHDLPTTPTTVETSSTETSHKSGKCQLCSIFTRPELSRRKCVL